MGSLHRSRLLTRALRALSFHPPIRQARLLPLAPSIRLHQQSLSTSATCALPPRRPRYPDTLPHHQYLYSIGYPRNSLDDLSPPLANDSAEMSLPPPHTVVAIDGQVETRSMTNKSIVYTCKRHDEYSYSCSCPAWAMQKGKPVDARSCKHLRSLLGDAHENARCDEAKETIVYTPETNPVNLKKMAREQARAAARDDKPAPKKRPASSLFASDSIYAASSTSIPKGARQASSTSKRADPTEILADVDEATPDRTGGRDLLLAHKFDLDGKIDPKGWWISEKLDGVRAYWDGQTTLWSRTGKALSAPQDFLDKLPRGRSLDGELYIGRNRFDETSGIVRSLRSPRWNEIKYMVFDAPCLSTAPFEERLASLRSLLPTFSLEQVETGGTDQHSGLHVALVEHELCDGLEHLKEKLMQIQNLGGEGLMLRQPGSVYVGKRSKTLLKVKTFYDAEAKVIGYEAGKGKYEGMTGSLICEMEDGKTTFSVGSGLTDERRQNPPPIGTIVTYRFFELTKQNIPRFPTFVGERIDSDHAKDAVIRAKDQDGAVVKSGGAKRTAKRGGKA